MSDDNKQNLQFFEGSSMRELYDRMRAWQDENRKRFLSVSVQNDGGVFCCIAFTNPTEVVITSLLGYHAKAVSHNRMDIIVIPR